MDMSQQPSSVLVSFPIFLYAQMSLLPPCADTPSVRSNALSGAQLSNTCRYPCPQERIRRFALHSQTRPGGDRGRRIWTWTQIWWSLRQAGSEHSSHGSSPSTTDNLWKHGTYNALAHWPSAHLAWTKANASCDFYTRGLWSWSLAPEPFPRQSFWVCCCPCFFF